MYFSHKKLQRRFFTGFFVNQVLYYFIFEIVFNQRKITVELKIITDKDLKDYNEKGDLIAPQMKAPAWGNRFMRGIAPGCTLAPIFAFLF